MSGVGSWNEVTGASTEEERAETYRAALQQERKRVRAKIVQHAARAKQAPDQERKAIEAGMGHLEEQVRDIDTELNRVGG